jgi:hypothetical protein
MSSRNLLGERERFVADIRFQFLINGKPVCTTGVEGFAVLSASLAYVKRDPERYDEQKQQASDRWSITREEWARESIGICANSLSDHVRNSWFDRELVVGDEVTIRVLGPGEVDDPKLQMQKK